MKASKAKRLRRLLEALTASEQIPQWVQTDSCSTYPRGCKVMHKGKVWISRYDGNVLEPGDSGWEEVK